MLEREKEQMMKLAPKLLAETGVRNIYFVQPPPSGGGQGI